MIQDQAMELSKAGLVRGANENQAHRHFVNGKLQSFSYEKASAAADRWLDEGRGHLRRHA